MHGLKILKDQMKFNLENGNDSDSSTPIKQVRMLSNKKREKLKELKHECVKQSKYHKKKYKSYKHKDEGIELFNSLLNASSISLIVGGFSFPPLLIASACLSGCSFVISNLHRTSRIKTKIEKHDLSSKQYNELSRHISSVLMKNNLTSQQYSHFLEEISMQINLIEDSTI